MDSSECKISSLILIEHRLTQTQGLVTAAQKLNRKGILDKYKKEIEEAYKSSS